MFSLVQSQYEKIYNIFNQDYEQLMDKNFETRIKQAISVLHFKYLLGACKEAKFILPKMDIDKLNLFNLVIAIYNKKRRVHQSKFFLLHCFENALHSTLAINFSNSYNKNADDWFLRTGEEELNKILNMVKRHCKKQDLKNLGSFGIFDKLYMIDLQELSSEYWHTIEHIFLDIKEYKKQSLPSL